MKRQEWYINVVIVRMAALQHYLYEEDLKAGDTGAAAVIAAEKEEMAHQQNVKVGDTIGTFFI